MLVDIEILDRSCLKRLREIQRRIQRTLLHRRFVVRHSSRYYSFVQVYPDAVTAKQPTCIVLISDDGFHAHRHCRIRCTS
ncbi:hypothetical protein C488_21077 [Natrinema pellirubrum DSM 15624]|uniref:Uncharacterized protein n=1 Tax=Natrinema pellirubrum (strain DSM 15624 / CIP 106293 / JCM 10476 / NCIMB 786 / 157) TaxID=797303 RepID=L9Y3J7_NATP1|nr:hypothetical protein C488_21077 [Natrinema pellirubrum DSM 15624]